MMTTMSQSLLGQLNFGVFRLIHESVEPSTMKIMLDLKVSRWELKEPTTIVSLIPNATNNKYIGRPYCTDTHINGSQAFVELHFLRVYLDSATYIFLNRFFSCRTISSFQPNVNAFARPTNWVVDCNTWKTLDECPDTSMSRLARPGIHKMI